MGVVYHSWGFRVERCCWCCCCIRNCVIFRWTSSTCDCICCCCCHCCCMAYADNCCWYIEPKEVDISYIMYANNVTIQIYTSSLLLSVCLCLFIHPSFCLSIHTSIHFFIYTYHLPTVWPCAEYPGCTLYNDIIESFIARRGWGLDWRPPIRGASELGSFGVTINGWSVKRSTVGVEGEGTFDDGVVVERLVVVSADVAINWKRTETK